MQRSSQTAGNLRPESRGCGVAARSYFPNCFVTESTQPWEQGLQFAGPYRHAFHMLPDVSYIQQQRTLANQSVLLEDTQGQALLSQETRHVLAAHQRRAAPLIHSATPA